MTAIKVVGEEDAACVQVILELARLHLEDGWQTYANKNLQHNYSPIDWLETILVQRNAPNKPQ